MIATFEFGDFGVEMQGDLQAETDSRDETLGHGPADLFAADEGMYMRSVTGQEHGSLPRGVSTSDNDHFLAGAKAGFNRGCRILIPPISKRL